MAHQVDKAAEAFDHFGQIFCQSRIVVARVVEAVAMVAHIHRDDIAAIGEAAGNHAPVPARAIEAMGDDQWHGIGGRGGGVQDRGKHATRLAPSARRFQSG